MSTGIDPSLQIPKPGKPFPGSDTPIEIGDDALKLPSKIRVAAFDINIEDWQPHSANSKQRYGEFSSVENVMRIDTSYPHNTLGTFLHEINHAIWWAYALEDGDTEERIAEVMSTAWIQIYRDNPEVLAFINNAVRELESQSKKGLFVAS